MFDDTAGLESGLPHRSLNPRSVPGVRSRICIDGKWWQHISWGFWEGIYCNHDLMWFYWIFIGNSRGLNWILWVSMGAWSFFSVPKCSEEIRECNTQVWLCLKTTPFPYANVWNCNRACALTDWHRKKTPRWVPQSINSPLYTYFLRTNYEYLCRSLDVQLVIQCRTWLAPRPRSFGPPCLAQQSMGKADQPKGKFWCYLG